MIEAGGKLKFINPTAHLAHGSRIHGSRSLKVNRWWEIVRYCHQIFPGEWRVLESWHHLMDSTVGLVLTLCDNKTFGFFRRPIYILYINQCNGGMTWSSNFEVSSYWQVSRIWQWQIGNELEIWRVCNVFMLIAELTIAKKKLTGKLKVSTSFEIFRLS